MVTVYSPALSPWLAWTSYGLAKLQIVHSGQKGWSGCAFSPPTLVTPPSLRPPDRGARKELSELSGEHCGKEWQVVRPN